MVATAGGSMVTITHSLNSLTQATHNAIKGLNELACVVEQHREQWLCEGEGQWPDKFSLLNRYVRADLEPPFLFND